MKALLCNEHGTPEQLQLTEVPVPEPGAGEVRIAIEACGINFPDVLMVAGKYQMQPPLPFAPGAEIAGTIDAVGSGVEGLQIGDKVAALTGFGGLQEYCCVAAKRVAPLPPGADARVAAAFTLTYGTSYHALKDRAALQAGETLVVLGAAGGVGLAAVELGAQLGARVIGVASTAEKLALARQYGATETINYKTDDLKDQIKALTDGRGADVIYDPVGEPYFDACMRSLAWGGRVLVVGFAGGDIPKVSTNLALLKGASIVGVFWGRHTEEEPALHQSNMRELVNMLMTGKLKPLISREFDLADGAAAISHLASRQAVGKVIVTNKNNS